MNIATQQRMSQQLSGSIAAIPKKTVSLGVKLLCPLLSSAAFTAHHVGFGDLPAYIGIFFLFIPILLFMSEDNLLMVFYSTPLILMYSFTNDATSVASYYAACVCLLLILRNKHLRIGIVLFLSILMLLVYDVLHVDADNYLQGLLASVRLAANVLFVSIVLANLGRSIQIRYEDIARMFLIGSYVHVLGGLVQTVYTGLLYGRFRGLHSDSNYTAAIMLIALSISLHKALKAHKLKLMDLISIMTFFVAGLATGSRTFLLCLIPLSGALLFVLVRVRRRALIIIAGIIIASLTLYEPVLQPVIQLYENRLSVSDLSNKRLYAWDEYLSLFLSSPQNTLWGVGRTSVFQEDIGIVPHSIYIESLVAWGVVGTFLYITFYAVLYLVARHKESRKSIMSYMPVLMVLLAYSLLSGMTSQVVVLGMGLGILTINSDRPTEIASVAGSSETNPRFMRRS